MSEKIIVKNKDKNQMTLLGWWQGKEVWIDTKNKEITKNIKEHLRKNLIYK